ncbi:flagellar motor protein MotB [Tabrizicola oligotrophica]|uniref:OmpA family protein n=1 Tax=Tabrizicola oligotrophica TaxID=2710650 RepID=A0A6M0QWV4_9RHOB|nr:flagellar motor protein MotB [Tabrizicola oligotrophica]NEY91163.1 OmpA family protein [Tabrizicola oligotrophica]
MAGQGNAAPVIIKRKKVVQGGGHHGGAWKVAYADFVTAMMAFFMLMWLLNATTEKQRKGIADYFNPTIPVNRVSGGGDGAFGGDSTFTESTLAQNGTGATAENPTESDKARGEAASDGEASADEKKELAAIEQALTAKGGESMTMERLLRHVVTRVTDEGLVIELFDLDGAPLFRPETAEPAAQTAEIAALLAEVLGLSSNDIAVNGHVRSYPITLREDPTWDLSTERAQVLRQLLEKHKLPGARIARVTGHADRKPATADPTALRNNRIEIVLLRRNR